MSKVEKLEQEIQWLSRDELAASRAWCCEYDAEEWGRQIEADARVGSLGKLGDEPIAAHKSGRTKEL